MAQAAQATPTAAVTQRFSAPAAASQPVSKPASQQPAAAGLPAGGASAGPPAGLPQVTGKTSPQSSPTPGAAGQADTLDDIGRSALNKGLALGGFAEQTARDIAASPGPDTAALEAQRAKDAAPTPYRDPNTGAILDSAQQYKPSGWQRFGRGLESAAIGLVTGGIPGAVVGALRPDEIRGGTAYGAPNAAYRATEAARQGRLGSEDQQIDEAQKNFKAITDARKTAASEARQGVTAYNDVAKGAGELENAGTNKTKAATEQEKADTDAQTRKDNSPEGVAALSEAQFGERGKEADRLGLRGGQRSLYLANGKLPDPRQATSEEVARAEALRTFRTQNGREPQNMDEINQVNAAASGRLHDATDDPTGPIVAAATGKKDEFVNQWDRQLDGSYLKRGANRYQLRSGDKISGQEFNARVEQFRLDANKELVKHGAQIDATGNVTRGNQNKPQAPAPPPGATHAYKDAQNNVQGWAVNGRFVAARAPAAPGVR
jgi:hypothetical protein